MNPGRGHGAEKSGFNASSCSTATHTPIMWKITLSLSTFCGTFRIIWHPRTADSLLHPSQERPRPTRRLARTIFLGRAYGFLL